MKYWPFLLLLSLTSCSIIDLNSEKPEIPEEEHISNIAKNRNDDIWSINIEDGLSATISAPKTASLTATKDSTAGTYSYAYWRTPQEKVTHYLVIWGTDPMDLSNEHIVKVKELDVVEDQVQGKMYRYNLHSLAKSQANLNLENSKLYYRLQALNRGASSPATPPTRARMKTPTPNNERIAK